MRANIGMNSVRSVLAVNRRFVHKRPKIARDKLAIFAVLKSTRGESAETVPPRSQDGDT